MSDREAGLIFDIDTFAIHDGPGIRMSVYFKGCPLACQWCHSPESRKPAPELIFISDRCAMCGTCVTVCKQGVHSVDGSKHLINYSDCIVCGQCVENCPYNALAIKGYQITANALVKKAANLKPFFHHSGGGVTLTGGEVTQQADFAARVLSGCQELGIHTAIETCGACNWSRLEKLIAHSDLILYDLKLIDESEHRRWTGVPNRQILRNAARLNNHNVQVRVPLIPGVTDTESNLRGIFSFMRSVGLSSVALLPYNSSAAAKYEWLGLTYEIQGEPQSREVLDGFLDMAREARLEAVIG